MKRRKRGREGGCQEEGGGGWWGEGVGSRHASGGVRALDLFVLILIRWPGTHDTWGIVGLEFSLQGLGRGMWSV